MGEESASFQGFVNDRAPKGFGDLGRMVIYFQGARELVIILGELGSKLIILGI